MTTLSYASPLGARRRDRLGALLTVAYFAGWVGGAVVAVTYAAGGLLNDMGRLPLFVGPALGSVIGLGLARVSRRRRWAHCLTLLVGLAAAIPFGAWTYNLYVGPRGWFWGLGMVVIGVAFAGGLSLTVAGLTGLWMMARSPYILTEESRAGRQ